MVFVSLFNHGVTESWDFFKTGARGTKRGHCPFRSPELASADAMHIRSLRVSTADFEQLTNSIVNSIQICSHQKTVKSCKLQFYEHQTMFLLRHPARDQTVLVVLGRNGPVALAWA